MSHSTPRVQGEPIVQGSDYGLGHLPSQERNDLFHNVKYATGEMLGSVNKSIERSFCVNLDPCEFNNDNDVVTKMLDTYGNMSTRSQPETGVSVTNQNTVAREGHRATQVALTPSQAEPQLYSFSSPLGAEEHGGRSRVGANQNAFRALPVQQETTRGRPIVYQVGQNRRVR